MTEAIIEDIETKEAPLSPFKEFLESFMENKGAVIGFCLIVFFILIAIFAPLITSYSPSELHTDFLRHPPFWAEGGGTQFILGTDDVGRDLLSRLVYGARISISIGFCVVIISLSIGTILGLFAGYYGGKTDRIIMRGIDILMALPSILLAMVVVSILGPGIENAIIAVAIVAIPAFTRIVRGSVLAEKEKQYVIASKTFGASSIRIMFKEILPNCMAPLIVQGTLGFSDGILNAAALGFLGLGAQPPLPEWGIMLSDARPFIESNPWMVTLPGLCILFVVLGFNLFGDGLRDALDPRLKR
jgi:ABC-type dipeptide/oligopeptide/nickel transport system permease subunit